MKNQDFMKYGTHFCNLSTEQIEEIFDSEEIKDLELNNNTKKGLLILSQILVGNISESIEELKKMRKANRKEVIEMFIAITKGEELKQLSKLVVREFI